MFNKFYYKSKPCLQSLNHVTIRLLNDLNGKGYITSNENKNNIVGSEVFTAVTTKNTVSWDIAPCVRTDVSGERLFTQDLHGSTFQKTVLFLRVILFER
jgi:hypothetical protein